MGDAFPPTEEELERVKIVLGDALPYELAMLAMAARTTQEPQFKQLDTEKWPDWLIRNATIEAFWTHARCLIEFFTRQNKNLDGSSASAKAFTRDDYWASDEIKKLNKVPRNK